MRVLHIVSGKLFGGVETILVTLARCRSLRPGMEPEFALCFEGALRDELLAANVPLHMIGEVRARNPLSVIRGRRRLRELLSTRRIDVVICHMAWAQAMFGPVARFAGVPLVLWMHGASDRRNWLERWAGMTRPDLAICNSQFTARALRALDPGLPAEVIANPVVAPAVDRSADQVATVRREFDTPGDAIVVAQVSRLEPLKGHRLHLEALGALRGIPGWVCWIVGGPQRPEEVRYADELRAIAERSGIGDRVRFLGQRTDVARLLSAVDIFCQPNIEPEGFGIALVEALYAGLPVVTSALGGAMEIVAESCGVQVAPGDVRALEEALGRLIQNRALRAELGVRGPLRAREICDPAAQMLKLEIHLRVASRRELHAGLKSDQHTI